MITWAAFEQGGAGATPGMGINTLIGAGNLDPLGPAFPNLGLQNQTLQTHRIGTGSSNAVVARSNSTLPGAVGGAARFVQAVGAPVASLTEILASGFFNASDKECPAEWWLCGVDPF